MTQITLAQALLMGAWVGL